METIHIWDGSNIVMELDGANAVKDSYLRGIGLLNSANKGYYNFNGHGDVVGITDSFGLVMQEYDYDAFGVLKSDNAGDDNPFRYCGEYLDLESGSVYLRNRNYSPGVGRFLTEDPIGSGLNWYVYCGNNPVAFIDPLGLVDVDLDKYAKTYGAVVTYTGAGRSKLKVTLGDSYFTVSKSALTKMNDRYIIDDSKFIENFGIGTKSIVVYKDATTGNVSIRAAFSFEGDGATSANKALFIAGIEDNWKNSTTSAYAREISEGIKTNIIDGPGVSKVSFGKKWSPTTPGTMTIYTSFSDEDARTASQFKTTAAHEFGHILGLGDSYESVAGVNPTASNDMMRWAEAGRDLIYRVSSASIDGAVKAYKTKKWQQVWW